MTKSPRFRSGEENNLRKAGYKSINGGFYRVSFWTVAAAASGWISVRGNIFGNLNGIQSRSFEHVIARGEV